MSLFSYRFRGVPFPKKPQILFTDKLTSCNLKIIFTLPIRVKSFFNFKSKLPKMFLSGLAYKYKCDGYSANFYGNTKRHFKVPILELLGITHLHERKVK